MTNAIFESVLAPRPDHLQLASPARAADAGVSPDVTGFYDEATSSIQYVVADPLTRKSAIIDPVLDFDPRSGSTRTTSADRLLKHIETQGLTLEWILDTHPHADHFSAAGYLKDMTGASTGIGERVVEMQRLWKAIYNLPDGVPVDGSQWDRLFADGERFTVGEMEVSVLLSPGHTLSSVTYVMGTRLSFTIPSSCPIRGRREPISREVMLGSSGGPFSGFCSCPARHASSRDTTTVQTAGGPLGKAPLLPRGRTICI